MSSSSSEIKGRLFSLSVLQLENSDLKQLAQQLDNKISQSGDFFFRAPIVINVEKVADEELDYQALKTLITQRDFVCVGVCNANETQKQQAHSAGLATLKQSGQTSSQSKAQPLELEEQAEEKPAPPIEAKQPTIETGFNPSKIIQHNIRSGQQIYAQNCDLIIIGSVSNGAEVIADGNIHIYGALRGRAIAGASGAKDSIILCNHLEAELVSIAGTYWLSDSLPESTWKQSVLIKLAQEQLDIALLQPINHPKLEKEKI